MSGKGSFLHCCVLGVAVTFLIRTILYKAKNFFIRDFFHRPILA